MADKGWTKQTVAAAGVAAGAGAAQLGIGYGLGIVVWPTTSTTGDIVWLSSLAWAVWIAAGSTVLGAVAALRLRAASQVRPGALVRLTLVMAAAVGAMLTVVLIALPARAAVRDDTFSPESIAAGYATVGVLLGLVIAWWAAASRPVAVNVLATSAWLWALAVVAVTTGLQDRLPATGVQLGNWRMTNLGDRFYYGVIHWPSAALAITAALLIGALAAWPAVRRGDRGLGAAASGAVGPLLVAAAYFTLAPQLTGARGMIESAFLITPYTVLAGLAGSAAVAALGAQAAHRRAVRRYARSRTAALADTSASPTTGWDDPNSTDNIVPSDWSVQPGGPQAEPGGRPSIATGRAKLPTPRAESTPPPRSGAKAPRSEAKPSRSDSQPPRSTVKPPPANPTVAAINPPRQPGDAKPSGAVPSAQHAPAAETPSRPESGDAGQAAKGPAPKGPAAGGTAAKGAKSTGASGRKPSRPAKSTPAAPTANGADVPPSGAKPAVSGSPGSDPRTAQAGADGNDTAAGKSAAAGQTVDAGPMSALSAAAADTAPLWVDDAEKDSDTDGDGQKSRWRRFGRRSGANATFDPDSEPPA
jgi:hypothetical protein